MASVYVKTFLAAVVLLGVLDFVWLGFIAKSFNDQQLQELAYVENGQVAPKKGPAILVYIVMALAITFFAAPVAGGDQTLLKSALVGAALGLALYATYDLTNLSIVKNYPVKFALVDIGWGIVLFSLVNTGLFFLRNWLN